jgi:septal ring factor EnvC (AmiA/AmiB activator)
MNTTTSLTLGDAASATGMVKSSILSAIKSCRLTLARGEFGQLRIEAAELHRELAETRARASLAEQRVADLTTMLDDIREQRDRWQAQADRLSSALTDQRRKAPRWWRWRRSTRDHARPQITHARDNPSDLKPNSWAS